MQMCLVDLYIFVCSISFSLKNTHFYILKQSRVGPWLPVPPVPHLGSMRVLRMGLAPLWATHSSAPGLCWTFQEGSSLSLGSETIGTKIWSYGQQGGMAEHGLVNLAWFDPGLQSYRKWILTLHLQVMWGSGLSLVLKLVWVVILLLMTQRVPVATLWQGRN